MIKIIIIQKILVSFFYPITLDIFHKEMTNYKSKTLDDLKYPHNMIDMFLEKYDN